MLISLGPGGSQGEGRVNADPSLFGLFSGSGGVIEVSGICGASLEVGVCLTGGDRWHKVLIMLRSDPGYWKPAWWEWEYRGGLAGSPAEGLGTELTGLILPCNHSPSLDPEITQLSCRKLRGCNREALSRSS